MDARHTGAPMAFWLFGGSGIQARPTLPIWCPYCGKSGNYVRRDAARCGCGYRKYHNVWELPIARPRGAGTATMITDPIFYRLFETSPETFFLLLRVSADLAADTAN
jgi:hypothetical protein